MSERSLREILWGDGDRRTATVLVVMFLVACIIYLLVVHATGIETEVIRDRYWKNAVPLFEGQFPVMEYPPLAIVFIAIPYLFGSTPWGYETAYVAEVFVFMVIGLLVVSRTAGTLGADRRKAMIAYAVLVLLMLEFVLDRFDIFVMVITLLSVMLLVERRYPWAFVLLAVGTLVKIYPALLFPIFILYMGKDGLMRDALRGALCFVLTGVLVMAAFWVLEPESVTNFLEYNTDRPLQVESLVSSVIYLLSMLGLTDVWIQGSSAESFWSDNLRGSLPDAVSDYMMPVLIVCTLAVWALYLLRGRASAGLRPAAVAMLACLVVFILANKVFSSQYLIWVIGPIVTVTMLSSEGFSKRLMMLSVLCIVLTQVNFAYNIGYLGGGEAIDDLGMMIILARNLVVLAIACMSVREMVRPESASSYPLNKSTS